ncbi:hypothetical protein G5B39_15255 (plasmid) [Rhodobacteraceae bacterium SC52]|nr:hypothetical protein G5B39_15255 [Rhodobacteraceae bacterium SC52]
MSASNTNIDRQTRRHRGPLVGIALSVATALVLFFGYLTFFAADGQDDTPNAPAATQSTVN